MILSFREKVALFSKSFSNYFLKNLEQQREYALHLRAPSPHERGGVDTALPLVPIIGYLASIIRKWYKRSAERHQALQQALAIINVVNRNEGKEIKLILEDAARKVAISYHFQLGQLDAQLAIEQLAAGAMKRALEYLKQNSERIDSFNSDEVIKAIFQGTTAVRIPLAVEHVAQTNSWDDVGIFSQTALYTGDNAEDRQLLVREDKRSSPETYGYRDPIKRRRITSTIEEKVDSSAYLFVAQDSKIQSEGSIAENQFNGHLHKVKFVPFTDMSDYAAQCRAGTRNNSFIEYVIEKYSKPGDLLADDVLVICHERPRDLTKEQLNLSEGDFSDIDLSSLDMSRVNLQNSNLRSAYLRGAILERANLTGACLDGADLGFAKLNHSYMANSSFIGAKLTGAELNELQSIAGCRMNGIKKFSGMTFKGTDLTGTQSPGEKLGSWVAIETQRRERNERIKLQNQESTRSRD